MMIVRLIFKPTSCALCYWARLGIAMFLGSFLTEWFALAILTLALFCMALKGLVMLADRMTLPED